MHAMRKMVDEEKEGLLKKLLEQMYARMSGDSNMSKDVDPNEVATSQSPTGDISGGIDAAEDEELGEENTDTGPDGDSDGDEDGLKNEIGSFMKNKHKPSGGKGIGMMISAKVSKALPKKSMKGSKHG